MRDVVPSGPVVASNCHIVATSGHTVATSRQSAVQVQQELEKQRTLAKWPARQAVLGMHEAAVSAKDAVSMSRYFKAFS